MLLPMPVTVGAINTKLILFFCKREFVKICLGASESFCMGVHACCFSRVRLSAPRLDIWGSSGFSSAAKILGSPCCSSCLPCIMIAGGAVDTWMRRGGVL